MVGKGSSWRAFEEYAGLVFLFMLGGLGVEPRENRLEKEEKKWYNAAHG